MSLRSPIVLALLLKIFSQCLLAEQPIENLTPFLFFFTITFGKTLKSQNFSLRFAIIAMW